MCREGREEDATELQSRTIFPLYMFAVEKQDCLRPFAPSLPPSPGFRAGSSGKLELPVHPGMSRPQSSTPQDSGQRFRNLKMHGERFCIALKMRELFFNPQYTKNT